MTNWTERLLEAIDRLTSHGDSPNGPGHRLILTVDVDELERLAAEARAALAQPEPEGVTERIASIATAVRECAFGWEPTARLIGNVCAEDVADLCGAILTHYARPTIEPVPVAEGPWEREGWCDEYGMCWWFNHAGIPEWQLASDGPYGDFSLPHHALPVPGAEVG
jgi:hypothetical protein